jgi:hypothetical protein
MGKYTLNVRGTPISDAREVLAATAGIKTGASGEAVTVTVDAPSLEEAKERVTAVLPEGGSYSVGRPEPLEDDPDD